MEKGKFVKEKSDFLRNFTKKNMCLLLFYPIYLLSFFILERIRTDVSYHLVECQVDHLIPFSEFFLIPYVLWHLIIVFFTVYTLLWDEKNFQKLMKYFIYTYLIVFIIYCIYPTELNLRPMEFSRENFFTWGLQRIYELDTSTNVCPSMHVIGCFGLLFVLPTMKPFNHPLAKAGMFIIISLIVASTMLLKQHSVLDVLFAVPIALFGWLIVFRDSWKYFLKEKLESWPVWVWINGRMCHFRERVAARK